MLSPLAPATKFQKPNVHRIHLLPQPLALRARTTRSLQVRVTRRRFQSQDLNPASALTARVNKRSSTSIVVVVVSVLLFGFQPCPLLSIYLYVLVLNASPFPFANRVKQKPEHRHRIEMRDLFLFGGKKKHSGSFHCSSS